MDKRVIFAIAGSGKTSYILDNLELDKRSLIITYTENNYLNLRERIIKKFEYLPDNISIYTYFNFLYSFCYKPFLHMKVRAKGYNWNTPPSWTMKLPRKTPKYFLDDSSHIYHNRLAKMLDVCGVYPKINQRIEKYFDDFYVDEVQDFGGHDFNFLMNIAKIEKHVLFVGDFFQHTFDTSRDGNVNKNLYCDYDKYIKRFEDSGVNVDTKTLCKSWRCTPNICNFVSTKLGIDMLSNCSDNGEIKIITDTKSIKEIIEDDSIIKLFYQGSNKYPIYSQNWGESKGIDKYEDVCIVLNKSTYKNFDELTFDKINPQTLNKLYVACTRARRNLIFISEEKVKEYKI
ncbi:MAG TPA: DNA helicase UvrD [Clostridiales bacterium]|nr:MAG: DNA helicase UvrD [Clostridiales bacterium GWD2_32_19]HCC07653.1 DNA helicase UvrD [Clostridiales bacterium]